MTSKSTILSQKEAILLESLIIKYGLVVTFSQIFRELKGIKSRQETYNLIGKLAKTGWLARVTRGVYYIANLESRGTIGISVFAIARLLNKDSYVSFEGALQHHGLFDQHLRTIRSMSLKKRKMAVLQNINYEFIKTGKKNFYDYKTILQDGQEARVATAEKAILDMLRVKRSAAAVDLIAEKLREYREIFDKKKLNQLSEKQPLAVQRVLGFLLDLAEIDSSILYARLKSKRGYSRMTADSALFNAKWRLYYHKHFR